MRLVAVLTTITLFMSLVPLYAPVFAATLATATVELVPNPAGTDSEGEYVSFTYSGPISLPLLGWTFENSGGSSIDFAFPDVSLASGDTFTVCAPNNIDSDCDANWTSGSFTNTGDTLSVFAPGMSDPVFTLSYESAADDEVISQTVSVLTGDEDVAICEVSDIEGFSADQEPVAGIVSGDDITAGDIIPPFFYFIDLGNFGFFEGQNFDAAGQELLADDCDTEGDEIEKAEVTEIITGDTFALPEGGWLFNSDPGFATQFEFNDTAASLGEGSIEIFPIDGDVNGDADKFIGSNVIQLPVEEFESLSYDFNITGVDASDANEFYLNVYANIDLSDNFYDCRFDFVPESGSVGSFTTATFASDDTPTAVTKRGDRIADCPATIGEMPAGSHINFFALNVGDTSGNDAGVGGHYDQVVLETIDTVTTWDFEPVPAEPGIVITAPETDGEILSELYTFEAEYTDADETPDSVAWAIRAGAGQCNGETLFGNVGGKSTEFSFDGADFSTTIDTTLLENGEYCFVVNPQENSGEDFRAVRVFEVDNEPIQCEVVIISDEMTMVEEKDGAFAKLLSFIHPNWTAVIPDAEWIWGDDPVADSSIEETQTFIESFVFSGPVTNATLYVAADNAYVAEINDEEAGADAGGGNFSNAGQDEFDVTALIADGENELEIAVTNFAAGTNPRSNPAGLLYRLEVVGTDRNCAVLPPEPATLEITDPAVDGEELEGEYTFMAEYNDDDETEDDIKWAIRAGTCDPVAEATMAGNVSGFTDPSAFTAPDFSATVDMSEWDNGEYCFVVNPQEQSGEVDLRATRTFTLNNPAPLVCAPEVNLLANASFEEPVVTKNRGWDLVDPVGWLVNAVSNDNPEQMELQRGVFGWLSSDGEQHTELGTNKAVTISQEIPTIAGKEYLLTWDYSPRPKALESENEVEVLVDGAVVATNEGVLAEDQTDWTSHSYEFVGTGEVVTIAFKDDGKSNGKGPLIDNTALVCDPGAQVGPHCGDGMVNQTWEQCEPGDAGCTEYCLFENQCSVERLVKITLEDGDGPSFDGNLYLGDEDVLIPSGTWFNFDEMGDDSFVEIANEVDGLAISRNLEDETLAVAMVGDNAKGQLDTAVGTIEVKGIDLGSIDDRPNPSFPLEASGRGVDSVTKSDNQVDFDFKADTGNDAFTVEISDAIEKFNCPDCKAGIEARVVLQDVPNAIGNEGNGNMAEVVVLGTGETVDFGEWFPISEASSDEMSATFIEDDMTVTNFANPADLAGLFVSREGDGEVKVALYAKHDQSEGPSFEYVRAMIEFRDGAVEPGSLEDIPGAFRFENHPETDDIDSNDNTDDARVINDNTAVAFELWANTGADAFVVEIDRESIAACEDDTIGDDLYKLSGHKWNDLNDNGVWDDVEPTLANWTIEARSGDMVISTTTNELGYYEFWVPAGAWEVSEVQQEGWRQTAPNYSNQLQALSTEFESDLEWELKPLLTCNFLVGELVWPGDRPTDVPLLVLEQDELEYRCDFGNHFIGEDGNSDRYSVTGFKFEDVNGDGVWSTTTESGLANWTITLSNGSTTATTTTDEIGFYSFSFNEPGTWTVAEVQQESWTQTAPSGDVCTAEFGFEEVATTSLRCDFGNTQIEVITEPDEEITSSGGGGGGVRRSAESGPVGQVLGAATTAAEQCGLYLTEYMRQGLVNDAFEVIKLQLFLNWNGYPTPITGEFDDATDASVRAFQLANSADVLLPWLEAGLTFDSNPTGYVFKTTKWKINDIVCPGIEEFPELP